MNGFHDKMLLAARNSQVLSHITELAQSLRRHPRDVVLPFFHRISEAQYKAGFDDAVAGFASRIENRAVEKRKEMEAAEGDAVLGARRELLQRVELEAARVAAVRARVERVAHLED